MQKVPLDRTGIDYEGPYMLDHWSFSNQLWYGMKRFKGLKRNDTATASFRTDKGKMNGLVGARGYGKVYGIGLTVRKPERRENQILMSNKQDVKEISFNRERMQCF